MSKLPLRYDYSRFAEMDSYYFKEGSHFRLYEKLGSHEVEIDGKKGYYFALWAPFAKYVAVIGDFNCFDKGAHPMYYKNDGTGIWECFIEGVQKDSVYKYYIESHINNYSEEKSDPYAFYWEQAPNSGSKTWHLEYKWNDSKWMEERKSKTYIHDPVSIYEVHLGSWMRDPEDPERYLSYKEIAPRLAKYVSEMGFTHIELIPITEHPYEGSWGYQCIGYFAPTSRFGTPEEFMEFVDIMHEYDIGVLLDWVPSHFAVDMHGLGLFDGTNLYEHTDPRKGFHPEWGSAIFNLGRNEVKNFLISSAMFWFDKYHIDGIRVDAVASMLYLNYAREDGEWIPNEHGGIENYEAVEFLQTLNHVVYENFPGVMMVAEESTAWPKITRPTSEGGLGFLFKWNMGWMHDSLKYFKNDPIYRKYQQEQLTFSMWYAYDEQFMLSLSHDEVVHMKGSLIERMPGDYWQKFANLRALYAYMFAHPGKKLLFMGCEFAQFAEWNYKQSLDWHLLDYPMHKGMLEFVKELHKVYKSHPALYANDHEKKGFKWVDTTDSDNSIISFFRFGDHLEDTMLVVCNLTPNPHFGYRVGVPFHCFWSEVLNSDSDDFGGSNVGNNGGFWSDEHPANGYELSLNLNLPPLGVLYFKPNL
ncbi:MAG: 1,4-alpha-glucan branching protein GlgB [Campylobacterales bacterium]